MGEACGQAIMKKQDLPQVHRPTDHQRKVLAIALRNRRSRMTGFATSAKAELSSMKTDAFML